MAGRARVRPGRYPGQRLVQPLQMIDYRGRVQKGRLLLEGHCVACGLKVARLLEG